MLRTHLLSQLPQRLQIVWGTILCDNYGAYGCMKCIVLDQGVSLIADKCIFLPVGNTAVLEYIIPFPSYR